MGERDRERINEAKRRLTEQTDEIKEDKGDMTQEGGSKGKIRTKGVTKRVEIVDAWVRERVGRGGRTWAPSVKD